MSKQIQKEAMLVELNMGAWNSSAFDREATDDLLERSGAEGEAARVRKNLVRTERVRPIRKISNKIRALHDHLTIPWDNRGGRLLPVKNYDAYRHLMDQYIDEREQAVLTFIGTYADAIRESAVTLGTLFNEDDYESAQEVRACYYAAYSFSPVPDGSHFIADVGDDEARRIQKSVEEQVQARITAGVASLFQRLGDAVNAFADHIRPDKETSNGKPPRYYDSILQTLRDVVDAVPALNLTDDPALKRITTEVAAVIKGLDMAQFRPKEKSFDPVSQRRVSKSMDRIREQMAGFIGAPK